jgi:hypothetical protein
VTLIGAGVTLHNCLAAADQLASDGIMARVLDLYSLKPIDADALLAAAAATSDRLVVLNFKSESGPVKRPGGALAQSAPTSRWNQCVGFSWTPRTLRVRNGLGSVLQNHIGHLPHVLQSVGTGE